MLLRTALDLKAELRGVATTHAVGVGGVGGGFVKVAGQSLPSPRSLGISLGIAPGAGGHDVRLAVRTTRMDAAVSQYVNTLGLLVSGDIEQQHVGDIQAGPPGAAGVAPWPNRARPILPGYSVAHYQSTAGTIGGFIQKDGAVHVLSNNHVLALSNGAQHNDPIVQPGPYDGGGHPGDSIARLSNWVPLQAGINYVDMAFGVLDYNMPFGVTYAGLNLAGVGQAQLGVAAWKVGRTTGVTQGIVTAVGLDDVPVTYNGQKLYFDDQLEIQGTAGLFSAGGDSGSLVIDAGNNAIGLLFAGSSVLGKTFANQLGLVLQHAGGTLLV